MYVNVSSWAQQERWLHSCWMAQSVAMETPNTAQLSVTDEFEPDKDIYWFLREDN